MGCLPLGPGVYTPLGRHPPGYTPSAQTSLGLHPPGHPPSGQPPPRQTPPHTHTPWAGTPQTPARHPLPILLECILVKKSLQYIMLKTNLTVHWKERNFVRKVLGLKFLERYQFKIINQDHHEIRKQ